MQNQDVHVKINENKKEHYKQEILNKSLEKNASILIKLIKSNNQRLENKQREFLNQNYLKTNKNLKIKFFDNFSLIKTCAS